MVRVDGRLDLRARLLLAVVLAALVLTAGTTGLVEQQPPPDSAVAAEPPGKALLRRVEPKPDRLAAFRGLSTWIDTYDVGLSPEQQVAVAADAGVRAIFLQTSRESTEGLLHDEARLHRTIELAHDAGIAVIAWTIPSFRDPALDLDRAIAAIELTTPRGDRVDAFGLDIEVDAVADVALRTARLLELQRRVTDHVDGRMPVAAIVLPPLQLQLNTEWWPGFPYAELAAMTDVTVPMSYSSYRGEDARTTYVWNGTNVVRVRELAGDPDLPVHLAGGIADRLPQVGAFVQAAGDTDAIGAGLYDLHTTRPEAWGALAPLRALEERR